MDWLAAVDQYCERTGPEYWAEPVNALTNAAFVLAAALVWPRVRGLPLGQAMAMVLAVIGVGSWLFHTHANLLTGVLDVTPIAVFILLYVFAAARDFLGLRPMLAGLVTAGFVPYALVLTPAFGALPFFGISAMYWPVPVLILIFAALLARSAPATSRGLVLGAVILIVSLVFRSLDQGVCAALPYGTHFLWHLLNAIMLGWMIEVWRRHVASADVRGPTAGRKTP